MASTGENEFAIDVNDATSSNASDTAYSIHIDDASDIPNGIWCFGDTACHSDFLHFCLTSLLLASLTIVALVNLSIRPGDSSWHSLLTLIIGVIVPHPTHVKDSLRNIKKRC